LQDDVGKQRRVNDFRRPRLSWRALQTQEQETRWAPQGSHRYEGLQAHCLTHKHRLSHTLTNIKEKHTMQKCLDKIIRGKFEPMTYIFLPGNFIT